MILTEWLFDCQRTMSTMSWHRILSTMSWHLSTNPYPDFIKRTYIFCVKPEGLTLYILWDVEKGKEEEGLKDLMTRILSLSHSVEGLTMSITPALSIEEIFNTLSKLGVTKEEIPSL
jgi:hypothetical protein